jgi:hypothetical protein
MTKNNQSAATIADVLHYAADHILAATEHEYYAATKQEYRAAIGKHKYSCCAVTDACIQLKVYHSYDSIIKGLKEMGCPTLSRKAFNDEGYHNFSEDNQQARYFWLKWAALMAEEQGV